MNKKRNEKAIVIKFGGSASTNMDGANPEYFKRFFQEITPDILSTFARAAFIIGGGPRVRELQKASDDNDEKDIIGIRATQEHAMQMGAVATQNGYDVTPRVPTSPESARKLINDHQKFLTVLGGLKIGQSTDTVAVEAASIFAEQDLDPIILILSNLYHVYTSDPNKDPNAKPIISADFRSLIDQGVLAKGKEHWKPGMHTAFDPVATAILSNQDAPFPLIFTHAENINGVAQFVQTGRLNKGTTISGNESHFITR